MGKRNIHAILPISFLVVLILFVWLFSHLPLNMPSQALDWKDFYGATHGFRIIYAGYRVFNPPWILAFLWPFTIWSLPVSRGLAALATLIVFVLAIPREGSPRIFAVNLVLLLAAYPVWRHLIDGNLEPFVVGGALLAIFALRHKSPGLLALSVLFLTAKIQESWLLLIMLAYLAYRELSRPEFAKACLIAGFIAAPFLIWRGGEWFQAVTHFANTNIATDISLRLNLEKLGVPQVGVWLVWTLLLLSALWALFPYSSQLDQEQVGLWVVAGLILSSYAGAISMATVMALAVTRLLQKTPFVGILLSFLYLLPTAFLGFVELRLAWENVYWLGVLLITWFTLLWDIKLRKANPPQRSGPLAQMQ